MERAAPSAPGAVQEPAEVPRNHHHFRRNSTSAGTNPEQPGFSEFRMESQVRAIRDGVIAFMRRFEFCSFLANEASHWKHNGRRRCRTRAPSSRWRGRGRCKGRQPRRQPRLRPGCCARRYFNSIGNADPLRAAGQGEPVVLLSARPVAPWPA